jgi:hypothetical protein
MHTQDRRKIEQEVKREEAKIEGKRNFMCRTEEKCRK